ncbi:MAG: hypothetical protein K0Q93_1503 [Nocardioidaceae bacterium]|nr:hypothetical protein [Nocardioidaceae bacterium]
MARVDEPPGPSRRPRRRLWRAAAIVLAVVVAAAGVLVVSPTAGPDLLDRLLGETDATPAATNPSEPTTGPEASDPGPPEPPGASRDQLLRPAQLPRLDPRTSWRVAGEGGAIASVCQPRPTARPRPQGLLVRRYVADSGRPQRAVQTVEVARRPAGAAAAYRTMIGWYAGCQAPRLQLISSFLVDARNGRGDVRILVLRRWSQPVRTLTVAVARSGVATTALVHEVSRAVGPGAMAMARSMSRALDRLCPTTGGGCGSQRRPAPAPPPPTGEVPGFLGVVDLPPVDGLNAVWAGTAPMRATGLNPAATLCDDADFGRRAFTQVRSRTFVVPESDLPQRFGLSETVARATRRGLAPAFTEKVAARVAGCPDRELSARIRRHDTVRSGDVRGHAWALTFEVSEGVEVAYRLGLVRRGTRIAQLSFLGTPEADIGATAFAGLVLRAGERLRELDEVPR